MTNNINTKRSHVEVIERLLWLDSTVRGAEGGVPAQVLRDAYPRRFSIDGRTTFEKDKRRLEELSGTALVYDSKSKCYSVDPASKPLARIMLETKELDALLIAQKLLEQFRHSNLFKDSPQSYERIARMVEGSEDSTIYGLKDKIHVIPTITTVVQGPVWESVLQAMKDDRLLSFTYHPLTGGAKKKRVEPYVLVSHKNSWYVLGKTHSEKYGWQFVPYHLSRITEARISMEHFDRDPDFALERHLDPEFGIHVNTSPIPISVVFDRSVAQFIQERLWHPQQSIDPMEDGRVRLNFVTNSVLDAFFALLPFLDSASSMEPAELRTLAVDYAERLTHGFWS